MTQDWLLRNTASSNDLSNLKIATLIGRRAVDYGDIGIEVEVEGNSFPKNEDFYDDEDNYHNERNPLIPDEWDYVHDGSLRGMDNAEYVLAQPIPFKQVPQALNNLWIMFDRHGSILDESNRTSVHVHLNATNWHLNRVCAFVALYATVEEVLTAWCGDHRVGNLFCLRAKDAPAILSKARSFVCTGNTVFLDDGLHYSGLNLHALTKHGSIEIRAMRGVRDPEIIQTWVDILERIYNLSGDHPDPRTICEMFSGGGSEQFIRYVLGRHTERVASECGMSGSQINESVRQGVRMAQRLCYCRDWGNFTPADLEPDPFGRMKAVPVSTVPYEPTLNPMSEIILSTTPSTVTWSDHFNTYEELLNEHEPI
jgi:hypothetical protein